MSTAMRDAPTVYLRIKDSSIAFEVSGEIIETIEYFEDGTPDWSTGAICDLRGIAGKQGYDALGRALTAAEENARLAGYEVVRLPVP